MIEVSGGMHRLVNAADLSRLHLGFSGSGPQDRFSMALANKLLGNSVSAGAIELTVTKAKLHIRKSCHLVVGGAPTTIHLNGAPVEDWRVFAAKEGSTVDIRFQPTGCRAYVCVGGGLRSGKHYEFAGDPITNFIGRHSNSKERLSWQPPLGTLRITAGPEFDPSVRDEILRTWRVDPRSNSMGVRLVSQHSDAKALPLESFDIRSGAVQDGTIQATQGGLIALLRHRGTLGGYPRVASIIDCDVDRLAQFRGGQSVRFRFVPESEAVAACQNQQDIIDKLTPGQ